MIRNRGFVSGGMPIDPPPVPDWPRERFASPLNEYIVNFKFSKICFSTSILADRRDPKQSWKSELPEAAIQDLRKTGQTDLALQYYNRALALQPKHLGANEYLGELYVELGQMDKAKERLAVLQAACGNCEQANDLSQAIQKGAPKRGS